ncbi:hypothetical protein like AT1G43760 [Hibiscus trionum]|uniref:Reverse transcriptase n=1 Tax=Hibiscus trionum TaxID=183268 RepID=A0A9W7IJW1_HIBTR|nr:hypothetical protein like AT1G43760 [Hibiscus trionum]
MDAFRSVLEDCDLDDLGYTGPWFTWEKGRTHVNNIHERLDRGVANTEWWDLFPEFQLKHLSHSFSDHCPLLLNTKSGHSMNKKTWHFRFEASWLLEESCEEEVNNLWLTFRGGFLERLHFTCNGLDAWFKKIRKEKRITKKDLTEKLERLNNLIPTDDILGDILDTKVALNFELDRDELYWEQRVRSNWLQHGDKNSAYFHRFASQRRQKNCIKGLQDSEGEIVSNEEEMHSIAREYFSSLFSSINSIQFDQILEKVNGCITEDTNQFLLSNWTEEVFSSVKSMNPLKAAREDGLGALFYQRFWHILGKEVAQFCIAIL